MPSRPFTVPERPDGAKKEIKMITKQDALSARHRQTFHHVTAKNRDGSPARCRVNGACKVWKTRPNEFKLPVKYGLYDCFYITERNAVEWNLTP